MYLKKKLIWNIDLNANQYPTVIKKVLFKKQISLRKKYTKWIGKISKKYQNDIDWWVSVPASRNPYFSKIFRTVCILETLKTLNNLKIDIISNSKSLVDILEKNFKKKNINIFYKQEKKTYNYKYLLKSILFQLYIYFIIKIFFQKKMPQHNKIILINNYPTNNKEKFDRHFQFSKKFLSRNYKNIVFTPTILINKNFFKIFRTLQLLYRKNYFFKETILNLKDLIFAFTYPLRIKKFKKKFENFDNFDLSEILYNEIQDFKFYNASMLGLINFSFIKRLNQMECKIYKTICWLENHEQKGWNYGIRKYFPKTKSFGYQGFTNLLQLMNTIPAKFEETFKVSPQTIIVSGKAYINSRKEFNSNLNVKVGPSLIYQDVHSKYKKQNKIKFLVILNEFLQINLNILEWVEYSIKTNNKLLFYVKKPKILNLDKYLKKMNVEKNFIYREDDLNSLLKISQNVITSGPTGSTLEAVGYNCSLIIPNIDPHDKFNLNSLKVPKKFFKVCDNKTIFSDQINYLFNLEKKKYERKLSNNLKNSFFEKMSIEKEKIFL